VPHQIASRFLYNKYSHNLIEKQHKDVINSYLHWA
jgi:hypothetical protein